MRMSRRIATFASLPGNQWGGVLLKPGETSFTVSPGNVVAWSSFFDTAGFPIGFLNSVSPFKGSVSADGISVNLNGSGWNGCSVCTDKPVDITKWGKIKFTVSALQNAQDDYVLAVVCPNLKVAEAYVQQQITRTGDFEIDVSSLSGDVYVGFMVAHARDTHASWTSARITNIWMTKE